jgi:hypothetical protein
VSRLPVLLSVLLFLVCQVDTAVAALRLTSDTVSHALAAEVGVYEDAAGSMSLADVQAARRRVPSIAATWRRIGQFRLLLVGVVAARRSCRGSRGAPRLVARSGVSHAGQRRVLRPRRRTPERRRPPSFRDAADPASQLRVPRALARVRDRHGVAAYSLRRHADDPAADMAVRCVLAAVDDTDTRCLSVYFGMLLALALYNLLLWLSLREPVYLSYVLFAIGMAVGQLSMNGLGQPVSLAGRGRFGETMRLPSALPRRACSAPCSSAAFSPRDATSRAWTEPSSALPACSPFACWCPWLLRIGWRRS